MSLDPWWSQICNCVPNRLTFPPCKGMLGCSCNCMGTSWVRMETTYEPLNLLLQLSHLFCLLSMMAPFLLLSPSHHSNSLGEMLSVEEGGLLTFHFSNNSQHQVFVYLFCLEETGLSLPSRLHLSLLSYLSYSATEACELVLFYSLYRILDHVCGSSTQTS